MAQAGSGSLVAGAVTPSSFAAGSAVALKAASLPDLFTAPHPSTPRACVVGVPLGAVRSLAAPRVLAALAHHVAHVVSRVPEEQMRGFAAGRVVAAVQHLATVRQRAVHERPCDAVGVLDTRAVVSRAANADLTVARWCAVPLPLAASALVWGRDPGPEAVCERSRFGTMLGHTSSIARGSYSGH